MARLRAMIGDRPVHIEIDGGVTPETAPLVAAAGAEMGLALLGVPESLGGVAEEASAVTSVLVLEELARGDMGLAVGLMATGAVATALSLYGSSDQQATYLPHFTGDSPVRAAALAITGPGVTALTVTACLSVLLVTWSWQQENYLTGFSSWLLVPLGTAILATISWAALQPALRITALRRRPEALARDILLVDTVLLVLVTASIAASAQTLGIDDLPRFIALTLFVGEANLLACLALSARWGTGASIGTTLMLMVTGALFGGQPELARTPVWVVAPYGYPLNATSTQRLATAIAVLAITCTVSWLLWARTLRRRAAE